MAGKGIALELVTAEQVKYKGDVEYVRLPAWEGEVGLLPNHAPMMALLLPGESLVRARGREILLATGEGFLKIRDNQLTVLVSFATRADEVEISEAEREQAEIQEKLRGAGVEDRERKQLESSLRRLSLELSVARKAERG